MNKLSGKIVGIESNQHMSLVDVALDVGTGQDKLTATLLETPATAQYLQLGHTVQVMFKETEVSLARNLAGEISLRNRLPVVIKQITRGDILSVVLLQYGHAELQSVVTTRAVERMQLQVGDALEALIKANEVILSDAT